MKQIRFDRFTEAEQGLISTALFIAIEQWRKDGDDVPSLKTVFDRQIAMAEGFREEIGF